MKEKYPIANPDVVVREEEKEALFFSPANGNMMCVNRTGMFIWGLCDGTRNSEDIAKEMVEAYDVTLEKAREDFGTYIKELESGGFIGEKI